MDTASSTQYDVTVDVHVTDVTWPNRDNKLSCRRQAAPLWLSLKLKVIEHRKLGYGLLFAFHSNYGRIYSRFNTIHERDRHPARNHMTARTALFSLAIGCSLAAKTCPLLKLRLQET